MRRRALAAAALAVGALPAAAHAAVAARFAYVAFPPQNSHRLPSLWALDADGTHRVRLLRAPGIGAPVWSPDRRTIAVGTCAGGRYTCKGAAVTLVDTVTHASRRLVGGSYQLLSWSPDGSRLLASRTDATDRYVSDFFLIGRHGRVGLVARSAEDASWSPDGSRIAYVRDTPSDRGDVFVLDLRTQRRRRLTSTEFNRSPVWSPDGRQIAYVDGSGHDMLALIRPDGSHRRVVQDEADAAGLRWLSNGLIGYRRDLYGPNGKLKTVSLATYDVAQGRRRVIAYDAGSSDWCTRGGGEVAYTTGDTTYDFGPRKLWLLRATGGRPRRLTSGGYGDAPQLAPDCSAVALTDNVDAPVIHTIVLTGPTARMHRIGVGRFVAWQPLPAKR